MSIESARQSALEARQAKSLDKLVRLDGVVTTWRQLIESGAVAYTTERQDRDGSSTYGLITHDQAREEVERGLRGLAFSSYWETPKLVADWPLFPRLVTFGYDGLEIRLPDGTVSVRLEPTL